MLHESRSAFRSLSSAIITRQRPLDLSPGRLGATTGPQALIKFTLAALFCSTVLPPNSVNAQAEIPPYSMDFESLPLGSIHGQRGWTVEQGTAEVVNELAFGGQQSLRLAPGAPFSQARLSLDTGSMPQLVMFLDFRLRTVATVLPATGGPGVDELLDVDGARIGLFRTSVESDTANLWLFNGDGSGGGSWVQTAATLPIEVGSGRVTSWARLSLRQDFVRQIWDCWLDGKLAATNLGFQESPISHTAAYILMGDAAAPVYLDDLAILADNPLAADQDRDGIPDAAETALGSDPTTDDRDVVPSGHTLSALATYLHSLSTDSNPEPSLNLTAPVASRVAGLVNAPFTLSLTASPGLQIRFSTDGSDPANLTSLVWPGSYPITLSTIVRAVATDGEHFSPVMTAAYLFPGMIAAQDRPAGLPVTFTDDAYWDKDLHTFSIPFTCVPWADVIGPVDASFPAPTYATALAAAPVVVLNAPWDAFFDAANGIYTKASHKGPDWKRPMTLQAFGMDQTIRTASATVAISGASSRFHDVTPKHGFRVKFQDSGVDLSPVFRSSGRFPCKEFLLRSPTHDAWPLCPQWRPNQRAAKYLADAWANAWLEEAGHLYLHRSFVHVFLNGTYWGVYEAVEQNDDAYLTRHAGDAPLTSRDASGVTSLLESGDDLLIKPILGSSDHWNQLRSEVLALATEEWRGHAVDSTDLRSRIDETNLIDYILWNCWLTNEDWPQHNYLVSEVGGIWRFINWDAEFGASKSSGVNVNMLPKLWSAPDGPAYLFCRLCHLADFRAAVLARWQTLTGTDAALTTTSLQASLAKVAAPLEPIIAAEAARWGAVMDTQTKGVVEWKENVRWVREDYIPNRTAIMEEHLLAWLNQISERQVIAIADAIASEQPVTPPSVPVSPVNDHSALADADHDGIPDDYEDEHGLNKLSATDGRADPDHDGLTNWHEYLLGTDPHIADDRTALIVVPKGQVFSPLESRTSFQKLQEEYLDALINPPSPDPEPPPSGP